MITSPPYNVGKDYDDDLDQEEYLQLMYDVMKEVYRILIPGGRACINIANIGRKPYLPLNHLINQIMIELGFFMRGEIIWDKGASAGASCAWGSWQSASNPVLRDVHEYIMVYSKGSFGRKDRRKGEKADTITRDEFLEYTKSIWTFGAESAKRVRHPAPFPVELPYRLIQLYSYKDDIVIDPFCGSGTTGIAALKTGRGFIGVELDEGYVDVATSRIAAYRNRPLPLWNESDFL
jgi:site-specific DNA-methyltransferase (adenine-specific)